MDIKNAKCSSSKHAEINAVSFCPECKKYWCNICQNYHAEMFEDHKTINSNQENEIFIDKCKEKNHNDKLEFYCKDHNTLCCGLCTSKFKEQGYGQHFDCDVTPIKKIKDEKRNKLKENINNLEELNKQIDQSVNKYKEIYEQVNNNIDALKSKIQSIFTKLRSSLNEKEEKLIRDIDEYYKLYNFKEDIIKKSEKLPKKIKESIEKGKKIDKEWNENNLSSLINDCINIENNIKEIYIINDNIKKCDLNKDIKIVFNFKEEQVGTMVDSIKNFGNIITEDNYKIEMKNPIHKITNHTDMVLCLCVLNDGRLVSGSNDKSIIIYNKTTYQPDLIIKEHNNGITCISQLSSGILVSCSCDKTIKLFTIKGMKYELLQTLNYHSNSVYKIIELKNNNLVSCSHDSSIIFYLKDNNEYKKDYKISTDGACYSIIQTKDNEICYSEKNGNKICFYNLLERKIKASIPDINKNNGYREWFIMIKKDLLLIPGKDQISIINTDKYKLVQIIKVPGSNSICGVCMLNENMILTGGAAKIIKQWKIEGDNLIMVSKKEKAHDKCINVLLNIGNGFIASGSDDNSIKIW